MGNALAKLSPCSIASDADYAKFLGKLLKEKLPQGFTTSWHALALARCRRHSWLTSESFSELTPVQPGHQVIGCMHPDSLAELAIDLLSVDQQLSPYALVGILPRRSSDDLSVSPGFPEHLRTSAGNRQLTNMALLPLVSIPHDNTVSS